MTKTLPFSKQQAESWQECYGTPIYVYDLEGIKKTVLDVQRAFSWNKGFCECFAVKATPTPAIIRLLAQLGCGTDCASVSELVISQASGLSGKKIMFTSNQTSDLAYQSAVKAGAIINLDDITQIERLEKAVNIPDFVCLRYNPGKFSVGTSDIMGHLTDSKFGMTKEQLLNAYCILKGKGVKHFGLHCMAASCCLDNNYYPALAQMLFRLVVEIHENLGIDIELVDLGGGIGIPYRPEEKPVDIIEVGSLVKKVYDKVLAPKGLDVAIYTEMGRFITGPNGYLVTGVRGFKRIYKDYVGVDATACDLIRPAMYGAYHHISVLGKESPCENDVPRRKVDVCGGLCENNDKFAVNRLLPEVEYGDLLVIHDAGAHGRAMGYNYNGMLRCGELLLDQNGDVKLIRRAESLDDLFATFDVDGEFDYEKYL